MSRTPFNEQSSKSVSFDRLLMFDNTVSKGMRNLFVVEEVSISFIALIRMSARNSFALF